MNPKAALAPTKQAAFRNQPSRFIAWRLFVYVVFALFQFAGGQRAIPAVCAYNTRANMQLCVFEVGHAFLSCPHQPLNSPACSCVSITLPAAS
jgi:hypothetical protein